MAVIDIVKDRAALKKSCRNATLDEARPVIQNLMDTAHYHKKNCAGLAANQIGYDMRVFVIKVNGKFKAFINPSFIALKPKVLGQEGCLSFPGKYVDIARYPFIRTTAPMGKKQFIELDGISAIAFQHELDHLDGITI